MSSQSDLYKRTYYHAVRRAILENETILKDFMDAVAINYGDAELELLDELLIIITDNDLLDLLTKKALPKNYNAKYLSLLEAILHYAKNH